MLENYKLIYYLLQKEKICGLQSIRCLLYILIIILILNINNNYDIINYLHHNYYISYKFNIKCNTIINNLINFVKNIKFIDINEIFMFYLNNDTIQNVKTYSKYYNHPILIKWIVNNIKPKPNIFIFDGNLKVNSYLNEIISYYKENNYVINYNNLFGAQDNQEIKEIINLELFLNSNNNFNSQIISHNILFNDINNINYNIIFFDITNNDIHNIIHAKCCDKIKKLKIRGTKYEPLMLQLILNSLEINGQAIVIVPYSLLFCDSILHTETRKYLLENYNLKKIIEIDDPLTLIKNIKKSILFIENNNNNNNKLEFSKIKLHNNNIIEENIIDIDYNKIINNNYILYSNIYITNNIIDKKLNNVNILNYCDLYYNINDINYNNNNLENILIISKYYKTNNFIKIISINDIKKYNDYILFIVEKENNDFINGFLYLFIEYAVNTKYFNFIKGTMDQIDIDKIKLINIPVISKETQTIIYNYNIYSNKLYNYNLTQIDLYKNLSKCIFDTIFNTTHKIELKNILNITSNNEIDIINNNYIGVTKNKLLQNNIFIINNNYYNDNNDNIYYLKLINQDFILDFIFYYLIYFSNYINTNIIINKKFIDIIHIPIIDFDNQKQIITNINLFNSIIDKHNIDNENIINKDITNLILKLNNLC